MVYAGAPRDEPCSPSRVPARLAHAVCLVALGACVRVPPPDLSREPEALLEQVRGAQARVRTVKGSARVQIGSPGGSGTVVELVIAQKPDSVRLETLDFFGNPVAVMTASGGRFAFFDAKANVYYRGDATPENVSRLLPFVIPLEELVMVLCGSAPILSGQPIEVRADQGLLLLTVASGAIAQRLAIGRSAAIESSLIRGGLTPGAPGGGPERPGYDLEFKDFQDMGQYRFPGATRLDAPAGKARIVLDWREDLEVNTSVEPAAFRLDPPRGARVVDLARGAPLPSEGHSQPPE